MSNILYLGEAFLSKVCEDNAYHAIKQFKVTSDDFMSDTEKKVFEYIETYARENGENTPSPDLVSHTFEAFNFHYAVGEDFNYLAKNLKSKLATRKVHQLLLNEASEKFEVMGGNEFIDFLQSKLDEIKMTTSVQTTSGFSIVGNAEQYLAEYQTLSEGVSSKSWLSPFPSLPPMSGGNMYTWYARSGVGKSILASTVQSVALAEQGARVLVWSLELPWYEVASRIYSHYSAKRKMKENLAKGISVLDGFNANELLEGKLNDADKTSLINMLSTMSQDLKGDIIIRGVNDKDFYDRSCNALEQDIINHKPDIVIIDPIYLMDMEVNKDKVAGGALTATSQRVRKITGAYNIATIIVTQAEELDSKDKNELQSINIPTRNSMRKSKALLEDASTVFALDTCEGKFAIQVVKGRTGNVNKIIEGVFNPSCGVVYEPTQSIIEQELAEIGFV